MKEININQKNAIHTISGPVLIIAGPGTGKTYTLVERVAHMVGDLDIDPSSILISTFTNKASGELLDRLSHKFKDKGLTKDVNDMLLGNFHSICRKILEDNIDYLEVKRDFSLIDDIEKKYLIYRNLDFFRRIPGYFDLIKTKDLNSIDKITKTVFEEAILERKSDDPKIQTIFNIVNLYEKILISQNKLDFSAVLFFTYKLLAKEEEVRKKLQKKINYIMVDEYQDTNTVQEKIIFSILNEKENICVVGDDDQGLYRFRGATVRNILHFQEKLKKKLQYIELDINYRSKKDIVRFYNSFISSLDSFYDIEKYRYKKNLKAFDQDERKSVFKLSSNSEEGYRQAIVDFILGLKNEAKIKDFNQVAILVSSVNDPRVLKLQTALREKNIGVYTPRTSKLINRLESKLILGALFAIFRPLIEKRKIPISYDSYQFLLKCYDEIFRYLRKDSNLSQFVHQMAGYLSSDKLNISILDIAYRLFRYDPFRSIFDDDEKEKMQKNISKILVLIVNFSKFEGLYYIDKDNLDWFTRLFFDAFIGFIKEENVSEFEEDTVVPKDHEISLLTIHASKGMEYPVVIMASLWDRPYKTYKGEFDKVLDEFLISYGKEAFEPSDYIDIFDFYRKYYTGFSRAQSLLILAAFENTRNIKSLGLELRPFFESLESFNEDLLSEISIIDSKQTAIKNIYSYTGDIAQYEYCPRAYKFFRKLRFARTINFGMVYGSLVHQSIEHINKSLILGVTLSDHEIYEKLREIGKNLYKSGASFISKKMLDRAFEEILKYKNRSGDFGKILKSEYEISLALEDYILTGNIDMIYEKDNKISIVDFKTGKNPGQVGKYDLLESYLGQLFLYANLYEKSKNESIYQVSLYFTGLDNTEDLISVGVDKDHLEKRMTHIDKLIHEIDHDRVYEKTNDIEKCKLCELRFYCDRM
ncbi:MAG: ATP-dependent DNA helicase [Tissierellia bacterium]|nr:ATP-dependent DNA helicase [Tissierellia bacterium]